MIADPPLHVRWLAEDLVRLRRADDRDRYAASQRAARIDANPHQIDAVIFALRRLQEGGCILADEVGLGKTIEAGLVIAQGRAEGLARVLLIVPKPLLGQWQAELLALFGIRVDEVRGPATGPGVFITGREQAGSARGAEWLRTEPFDLCVIDEAHEVFAALYRRYRRDGVEDPESKEALTAHAVRQIIGPAPVLLLTATPIQNNLTELWGLVQYVEPTATLLGDLATFREVFCAGDDRALVPGQENELQRRVGTVLQRTLRRQAQEFLDKPFVERHCKLFRYTMGDEERELYEDVTEYLMRPALNAFAGKTRTLLLLGFHRRMASSSKALAVSLEHVARRLRALLERGAVEEQLDAEALSDLDDDEIEPDGGDGDGSAEVAAGEPDEKPTPGDLAAELALVESFAERARKLPTDAKARAFEEAIKLVIARGRSGEGSGKAVVFTESLTTQGYIRDLLVHGGLAPDEVTLFRGTNDDERASQALERWRAETSATEARASREVQVRLALVHEFRTRSKVLVCTEAGAKGLNLQFAETLINYDLPWNPQRIEQRIGRCHRYGQERAVTVVNFLASDNAAQQLTFEILSQKLDLFGKVLDASDVVLHQPQGDGPQDALTSAVAVDIQTELNRIHQRARTVHDIARDLVELRNRVEARRKSWEAEQKRTASLIESRFDEDVKKVFRGIRDELRVALARFDRDICALVASHFEASGTSFRRVEADGRVTFEVGDRQYSTGDPKGLVSAEALGLAHPIVAEALAWARNPGDSRALLEAPEDQPQLVGKTGCLIARKVTYDGFEPVARLIVAAVVDGIAIETSLAGRLVLEASRSAPELAVEYDERALEDALEEALFVDQRTVEAAEQQHFERVLGQLERFVDDRALVKRKERAASSRALMVVRKKRDDALGPDARARAEAEVQRLDAEILALDRQIEALDAREDEEYRRWRQKHYDRRYSQPVVTDLFRATFRLVKKGSLC